MSSNRTDPGFERVLDAAVVAGKFSEGRKDHYRGLYQRDPGGTRQAVAALHAVDRQLVAALSGSRRRSTCSAATPARPTRRVAAGTEPPRAQSRGS